MPKEEVRSRVLPLGLGITSNEVDVELCITVLAGAVRVLPVCCSCSLNDRPSLSPVLARSANCLCVNGDSSLQPLYLLFLQLQDPASADAETSKGPLLFLLIFHSSNTQWVTETYPFFFPLASAPASGPHLQDNFRVFIHTPSLFLLITLMSRCHLFLFFFLSPPFHEVCFAQGYISLSTLGRFVENPLLFIIVLVWKLSIKMVTQCNCSYLQRHSK